MSFLTENTIRAQIIELRHIDCYDGQRHEELEILKECFEQDFDLTCKTINDYWQEHSKEWGWISSMLCALSFCMPSNRSFKPFRNMLKAALMEKQTVTQEGAMEVVERWRSKWCLDVLKKVKPSSAWMKDYINKIIVELQKEQEHDNNTTT